MWKEEGGVNLCFFDCIARESLFFLSLVITSTK